VSNNDDFDFSAQTVSVRRCAMLCFIREMNLLAKTLNLYYTFFQNPHGLSESTNISCANDQLSLSLEALKNEYVQQIAATKTYTLKIPNERLGLREVTWNNTNRLLWRDGYVGLKTGITRGAGACLISQYIIRKNCRINTEELTKKT
jgi:D-alanyl-D-alanine carboxypeptidase (penicillin-binding protein 5/6)